MSACAWTGLDKLSRSVCAIIAGMVRAFADPCTCVSPNLKILGKGASLLVLLKRKLMIIDCRLSKSCAAMTAQWGLYTQRYCSSKGPY